MSYTTAFFAVVEVTADEGWHREIIDGASYLVRGEDPEERCEVKFEPDDVLESLSLNGDVGDVPWTVKITSTRNRQL